MIWLLWGHYLVSKRGKIKASGFYYSAWTAFFALFMQTLFSRHYTQIYHRPQALTLLRSYALSIHALHFSGTLLRDISVYARCRSILRLKVKISSNFPLKSLFLSFFAKSKLSTPFFISVFKTDFNICEPLLPFRAH